MARSSQEKGGERVLTRDLHLTMTQHHFPPHPPVDRPRAYSTQIPKPAGGKIEMAVLIRASNNLTDRGSAPRKHVSESGPGRPPTGGDASGKARRGGGREFTIVLRRLAAETPLL